MFWSVRQKRKLGPGSYNIQDFLQLIEQKPCSTRGVCNGRAGRFGRGNTVSVFAWVLSLLLFFLAALKGFDKF